MTRGRLSFELRPTPFGHVGLFVEQAANWDWIESQVRDAEQSLKVLNLFAYTGGSTLAAAAAGARVTHVDAAKNVVAWARSNAIHSGLADAPIRWITEDALKFVRRELKRGHTYDAVILDPPAYGHGPAGEVWNLSRDLPELLKCCIELTNGGGRFQLVSCHSLEAGPEDVRGWLAEALGAEPSRSLQMTTLSIASNGGRSLPQGIAVRWSSSSLAGAQRRTATENTAKATHEGHHDD